MNVHESKRVANDLARSVVVVLIVEAVNTLRVVRQSQCDVFGESLLHKAIDRIVHRRNFIASGAANEQKRNFSRVFLQISDRRKSLERFGSFSLSIIRQLDVHEGVETNQATDERHLTV